MYVVYLVSLFVVKDVLYSSDLEYLIEFEPARRSIS